jgi:aryl-alcohol dehydrogenase-like predicted oxidoreductase
VSLDRLTFTTPYQRIGLGLAAVGRPGYINLGHATDLPAEPTVAALRERAAQVLDEAYARGVRYVDAARSYGRAEEFLADWLRRHEAADAVADVVVGSKWGYTYTAGWRVDAEVHETKDHGVATFDRQLAETRALLGDRLDLYQIHSVTPDSPALTDTDLHRRLAALAEEGVTIGLSVSGPDQDTAIRAALRVRVAGRPLFHSVQATWNLLEPSAGPALSEAHGAGCAVIVKEALANGRLVGRKELVGRNEPVAQVCAETGATPDAVALAAVLHQPWVTVVLSGASTTGQLAANLEAATLALDPGQLSRLATLAEPPDRYWKHRSSLPWN